MQSDEIDECKQKNNSNNMRKCLCHRWTLRIKVEVVKEQLHCPSLKNSFGFWQLKYAVKFLVLRRFGRKKTIKKNIIETKKSLENINGQRSNF